MYTQKHKRRKRTTIDAISDGCSTNVSQLLAEYIQYQYIKSTDMFSQIVGSIYSKPI